MLVKVNALSDAYGFMAEELAAVVRGDAGAGVNGFDRMAESFHRDAKVPLIEGDPGFSLHPTSLAFRLKKPEARLLLPLRSR
jgi:hypothetical protein